MKAESATTWSDRIARRKFFLPVHGLVGNLGNFLARIGWKRYHSCVFTTRLPADSRMNPISPADQSIPFSAQCKVEDIDGTLRLIGSFDVPYNIAASANELDEIIALAEHIGQVLKQNIAIAALEHADQQAARLAQEVAPHLHKHGSRPFTLIAPYGRFKLKRQRLFDPRNGKTCIPSAKLWTSTASYRRRQKKVLVK
jgi:hypothetical protein